MAGSAVTDVVEKGGVASTVDSLRRCLEALLSPSHSDLHICGGTRAKRTDDGLNGARASTRCTVGTACGEKKEIR
jgi:hypothetical protein